MKYQAEFEAVVKEVKEELDSIPADLADQYGDRVPDDLALLPEIEELSMSEIDNVVKARWYEIRSGSLGYLFASSAEMGDFLTTSLDDLLPVYPKDAGLEILRVDLILKRWDITDGFYHA